MLAAGGAGRVLAAACVLLLLGDIRHAAAAPGDIGSAAIGPAETDLCEEPLVLEPGLHLVHCISPTIRMTPGQVHSVQHFTGFSSAHSQHQPTLRPLQCEQTVTHELNTFCAGGQHQLALSQPIPSRSDSCNCQSVSAAYTRGRQVASHPK